ncbi:uncharacterized protein LOC124814754 [Hydra vulgaris]|uniref:uncharacterized protein LOC124814754 n=1 Tax=Hydra vulgaris TaxID=6087 RepID=UPI0032EA7D4A
MGKVAKSLKSRTRCTSSRFAGLPNDLPVSDLPTFKQVIQFSYKLNKQFTEKKLTDQQIVSQISIKLVELWRKVNSKLPLIHERSIRKKLELLFKKVLCAEHKKSKGNKSSIVYLEKNFDSLFDLSACNCELPVANCDDRLVRCDIKDCFKKHILCNCDEEKKVPVNEREYLKDQRAKKGGKGSFQIGKVDQKGLIKLKNKQVIGALYKQEFCVESLEESNLVCDDPCFDDNDCDDGEIKYDPDFYEEMSTLHNYKHLPNFAKAAIRYGISNNAAAHLGTGLLIDYGIVTAAERTNIITEKKVFSEKFRIGEQLEIDHSKEVFQLKVIGVDDKKDKETLVHTIAYNSEGEPIIIPGIEKEAHLTFTAESGTKKRKYLTHKIITSGTGVSKANATKEVLTEFDSTETLEAMVLDNTSSNTGTDNGLVVKLEKFINRKLHLVGCQLHQNELPLRQVIILLDGNTNDPKKYKGPVCSSVSENSIHELPLIVFSTIMSEIQSFVDERVVSDLSNDQRKLYEYTIGISTGKVSKKYAMTKPGPVNHARWLTLALRIMYKYTRETNPSAELVMITKYIVQVYSPIWFAIKRSGHYKDSAKILFKLIELTKLQDKKIQEVVFKNLAGNSFCCLQENFLYCMIMDDEKVNRDKAIDRILIIRKLNEENKEFVPKLKPKTIMKIDFDCNCWIDLVQICQIKNDKRKRIWRDFTAYISSKQLSVS